MCDLPIGEDSVGNDEISLKTTKFIYNLEGKPGSMNLMFDLRKVLIIAPEVNLQYVPTSLGSVNVKHIDQSEFKELEENGERKCFQFFGYENKSSSIRAAILLGGEDSATCDKLKKFNSLLRKYANLDQPTNNEN